MNVTIFIKVIYHVMLVWCHFSIFLEVTIIVNGRSSGSKNGGTVVRTISLAIFGGDLP